MTDGQTDRHREKNDSWMYADMRLISSRQSIRTLYRLLKSLICIAENKIYSNRKQNKYLGPWPIGVQ